jgi:hypothetical protein
MAYYEKTGLEFIRGFALFAGLLWLLGALSVGTLAMLGNQRLAAGITAEAHATSIGESPETN